MWKDSLIELGKAFFLFIGVLSILAIIGTIIYFTIPSKTTSPVESNNIDSLTKVNNKVILKVESLDNVKDAKIIEVKSLDNDSTLSLFYQLIGK